MAESAGRLPRPGCLLLLACGHMLPSHTACAGNGGLGVWRQEISCGWIPRNPMDLPSRPLACPAQRHAEPGPWDRAGSPHTPGNAHTGLDLCRSHDVGVYLGLRVPQLITHPSAATMFPTVNTSLFNTVKQRLKINITKENFSLSLYFLVKHGFLLHIKLFSGWVIYRVMSTTLPW